jgi:hypothetical protein
MSVLDKLLSATSVLYPCGLIRVYKLNELLAIAHDLWRLQKLKSGPYSSPVACYRVM